MPCNTIKHSSGDKHGIELNVSLQATRSEHAFASTIASTGALAETVARLVRHDGSQARVVGAVPRGPIGAALHGRQQHSSHTRTTTCRLNKCNPQNLSNFVWAVVERGLPLPEGAWDKVAQQAVLLMPSANAQSVAVLCRGVGRQGLE